MENRTRTRQDCNSVLPKRNLLTLLPAVVSFQGMTINMKAVRTSTDVIKNYIRVDNVFTPTQLAELRKEAAVFIKQYKDHYIKRRKEYRAKEAARRVAESSSLPASHDEADASVSIPSEIVPAG